MNLEQEREIEHAIRLQDWLPTADWSDDSDEELAEQATKRLGFAVTAGTIAKLRVTISGGLPRNVTAEEHDTPQNVIRKRRDRIRAKWGKARERQARGLLNGEASYYTVPVIRVQDISLESEGDDKRAWSQIPNPGRKANATTGHKVKVTE